MGRIGMIGVSVIGYMLALWWAKRIQRKTLKQAKQISLRIREHCNRIGGWHYAYREEQ